MRNDASRLTTGATSFVQASPYHWAAFFLIVLTLALAPERGEAERALLLPQATLAPEEPEPEEGFGRAFAIDGDVAVVTANIGSFFGAGPEDPGGAAYVFERNSSGEWHQTAKLEPLHQWPAGR